MAPRYIAPAQVMVTVNGIWVDDVQKIEYQVSDSKTPVYGYNDRLFRSNMLGKTLVQGRLCINFRFPGYLNRAILSKEDSIRAEFKKKQLNRFGVTSLKEAKNIGDLDPDEVIARVAREYRHGPAALGEAADFFSRLNGVTGGTTGQDLVPPTEHDAPDQNFMRASNRIHRNVELIILYGNPDTIDDPERVEIIKNPQFDSMGKVIRMDVPSGGQPILEEYTFYAQDVVNVSRRRAEPVG